MPSSSPSKKRRGAICSSIQRQQSVHRLAIRSSTTGAWRSFVSSRSGSPCTYGKPVDRRGHVGHPALKGRAPIVRKKWSQSRCAIAIRQPDQGSLRFRSSSHRPGGQAQALGREGWPRILRGCRRCHAKPSRRLSLVCLRNFRVTLCKPRREPAYMLKPLNCSVVDALPCKRLAIHGRPLQVMRCLESLGFFCYA